MFRRVNAEIHLLITITSFVGTVLLIRGYLYIAGYPQLGGGELHIAHMLWGGLALFASSILMLLYRGLYIARVAAVLTGVGFGFFIDEIGKFLTRTNDYFFAPAAVIIYIVFLLFVGAYLLWFRPRLGEQLPDDNEAFSDIRELLDGVAAGELTKRERLLLKRSIERLVNDDQEEYRVLGSSIRQYVRKRPLTIKQQRLESIGSVWSTIVRWLVSRRVFIYIVIVLFVGDLLITLTTFYQFLASAEPVGSFFATLFQGGDETVRGVNLIMRIVAQVVIVAGGILLATNRIVLGRRLIIGALLVIIVLIDSIDFYFSQFSTAYTVTIDALLLAMIEARFGNEKVTQISDD